MTEHWQITIRGTGPHHSADNPDDANRIALRVVRELRAAGHLVHDAFVLAGGDLEHVTAPAEYERKLLAAGQARDLEDAPTGTTPRPR